MLTTFAMEVPLDPGEAEKMHAGCCVCLELRSGVYPCGSKVPHYVCRQCQGRLIQRENRLRRTQPCPQCRRPRLTKEQLEQLKQAREEQAVQAAALAAAEAQERAQLERAGHTLVEEAADSEEEEEEVHRATRRHPRRQRQQHTTSRRARKANRRRQNHQDAPRQEDTRDEAAGAVEDEFAPLNYFKTQEEDWLPLPLHLKHRRQEIAKQFDLNDEDGYDEATCGSFQISLNCNPRFH